MTDTVVVPVAANCALAVPVKQAAAIRTVRIREILIRGPALVPCECLPLIRIDQVVGLAPPFSPRFLTGCHSTFGAHPYEAVPSIARLGEAPHGKRL